MYLPFTGSCSLWQTRSASLLPPLRKQHWTRFSSSPESQSAGWLMGTADQGSACSTPAPLGLRRTEYTEAGTHKHMAGFSVQTSTHEDIFTSSSAFKPNTLGRRVRTGQKSHSNWHKCQIIYSYWSTVDCQPSGVTKLHTSTGVFWV